MKNRLIHISYLGNLIFITSAASKGAGTSFGSFAELMRGGWKMVLVNFERKNHENWSFDMIDLCSVGIHRKQSSKNNPMINKKPAF